MAFPSSTGSTQENLAQAWGLARDAASAVKHRSQELRALSAAGQATSDNILHYAGTLLGQKTTLQKCAALPGIAAYAREQIDNPELDIVAEFAAMMTAIDATTSWVITNFPKDGSGFLLARTFTPDNSGNTVARVFTAPQTATLRAALDALIAAID